MPEIPSLGQLLLLAAAIIAFAAGGVASLLRLRTESESARKFAKLAMNIGIALSIGVLIWHSISRGSWLPLEDNFDALIWLGVLLALFVQYTQRSRPLGGLEWLVMPIVILLLAAAGLFGRNKPHEYVDSAWHWTHRVTAYGGTLAFFIAGVAGVMYLLKQHQLRTRHVGDGPRLGSLERLEHITFASVTLGFALLTIGLVTGLVRVLTHHGGTTLGPHWWMSPKVLLTFAVWGVYAAILHSPINPSFRGRKAAILSVCGLALTIGTLVAAQFVPSATPQPTTTGGPR